jgi:hypothetical protein
MRVQTRSERTAGVPGEGLLFFHTKKMYNSMATKTKKATSPALGCGYTPKTARKVAALLRKVTGRKTIKAQGGCVISTSAVSGTRKRKRKSTAKRVRRTR